MRVIEHNHESSTLCTHCATRPTHATTGVCTDCAERLAHQYRTATHAALDDVEV